MKRKQPKPLTRKQLFLRMARSLWPIQSAAWYWGIAMGERQPTPNRDAAQDKTEVAMKHATDTLRALKKMCLPDNQGGAA